MNMGRVAVQAGGKTPADQQNLASLSNLEFNHNNFNFLIYEILKLKAQRIDDLEMISHKNNKILEQQDKIITLNSKLNRSELSPLRIAG